MPDGLQNHQRRAVSSPRAPLPQDAPRGLTAIEEGPAMSCCCAAHVIWDPAVDDQITDWHGRVGIGDGAVCPACPQHGRPAPDIEALAAAVHEAWMKEKQAQGWAGHPIAV